MPTHEKQANHMLFVPLLCCPGMHVPAPPSRRSGSPPAAAPRPGRPPVCICARACVFLLMSTTDVDGLGTQAADSARRTANRSIVGPTVDLTDSRPAPHRSTHQSTETPLRHKQTTHPPIHRSWISSPINPVGPYFEITRTSTPEKATASKTALRSGGSIGPAAGWLQTKVSVTAPLSVF